jgi:hypothetical protein
MLKLKPLVCASALCVLGAFDASAGLYKLVPGPGGCQAIYGSDPQCIGQAPGKCIAAYGEVSYVALGVTYLHGYMRGCTDACKYFGVDPVPGYAGPVAFDQWYALDSANQSMSTNLQALCDRTASP